MNALAYSSVLVQALSSAGDGTGTTNYTGDYSATPAVAYIASATDILIVRQLVVTVGADSGLNQALGYGKGTANLTNGVQLRIGDGTNVLRDLLAGLTIKANRDWERHGATLAGYTFGSAPQSKAMRFDFAALYGAPLEIMPGQRLEARFSDAFGSLVTDHRLIAYGSRRTA